MRIHIVVPCYRALSWFKATMDSLRIRAAYTPNIAVTIVNMSDTESVAMDDRIRVIDFHCPHLKGGEPLPVALAMGVRLDTKADVTVTVDTDAPVMRQDWDLELLRLFSDPELVCAAINPRGDTPEFKDTPEWNWMAFRTKFWLDHVGSFDWAARGLHDIGHVIGKAAKEHGKKVKLWTALSHPYPGKAATMCGDEKGPWALHAFFSSRRFKDDIHANELSWILTPEQEAELQAMVMR